MKEGIGRPYPAPVARCHAAGAGRGGWRRPDGASPGAADRAVLTARRPVRGPASLDRPLAAPRLPRWALRELELVRVLRSRGASRRALRDRLGISVRAIRMRERLASVLAARLRGVPPATTRPREIVEDRHALLVVEQLGADRATPEQRRRAERHRRRLRACQVGSP
jgi:hypothetical protein